MSRFYVFHDQAGCIPGVPGTFSHCVVEVEDDGTFVSERSLLFSGNPLVVDSTIEPVAEEVQPPAQEQEQPLEQEQQTDGTEN